MSEYFLQELPYTRDSAALLSRLATLPGLVFLDSGLGNAPHVRYDILSALPDLQIIEEAGSVRLREGNAESPYDGDVFAAVAEALRLHAPAADIIMPAPVAALPFKGGAIGCFGYERQSQIGIYNWAIVVDHQLASTWLFALPTCPAHTLQRVRAALQANPAAPERFRLEQPFVSNFTADAYKAAFERIQDYIQAGDCYQVNLAQRFASRYEGDPLSAYLQLRQHIHSPFAAYLQRDQGAVLSFSPERFISVIDGTVLTQPIKGTRPRSSDVARDTRLAAELQASEKDRAENLMIVDLLRNDLGKICETGSVRVDKLFELHSFSNVHHLVSSISARLDREHSPLDLLRSCFPGGSITGAPKRRAMQIIEELEPDGRAVYCGAIGYIGFDGRMDSNITIRTLLCEAPDILCWGGGGIVADSVWSAEYQECYDKINNLIKALY